MMEPIDYYAPRREFNAYLLREWPRYVVGPDMPRFTDPRHGATTGVYFLFNGNDVVYIGQSASCRGRVEQHRRNGRPFTEFGSIEVPPDLMLAVEIAYIHALKPVSNTLMQPPPFHGHDELVAAIHERWKSVPLLKAMPGGSVG
jgi:hypothetical protein